MFLLYKKSVKYFTLLWFSLHYCLFLIHDKYHDIINYYIIYLYLITNSLYV